MGTKSERDNARFNARARHWGDTAARTLDGARHAEQVGTLESRIDATETQPKTTESERDTARSKARAQSVAMAAKKGLDDLRRAEGVGTTEGGKISESESENSNLTSEGDMKTDDDADSTE